MCVLVLGIGSTYATEVKDISHIIMSPAKQVRNRTIVDARY